MQNLVSRIEEFISIGWNADSSFDYASWENRVYSFLSVAIDSTSANAFRNVKIDSYSWKEEREKQIGHLEGLAVHLDNKKKGISKK